MNFLRRKESTFREDAAALQRIWQHARPEQRRLLVAVGCGLAAASLSGLFFYLLKPALDRALGGTIDPMPLALLLVGFYAGRGLLQFLSEYLAIAAIQDTLVRLRQRFLRAALLSGPAVDLRGEQIGKFFEDLSQMCGVLKLFSATLVRDLLTVLALIGVLFYYSPRFAFWLLGVYLFASIPLALLGRAMRRAARRSREINAGLLARVEGLLRIRGEVRGFPTDPLAFSGTASAIARDAQEQKRVSRYDRLVGPLMEVFAAAGFVLLLWKFGGRFVQELQISGSIAFFAAGLSLFAPLRSLGNLQIGLQRALASEARVRTYLHRRPPELDITDGGHERLKVQIPACINAEGRRLLRQIELVLSRGQAVALVGANGAGKSTLLRCIAGMQSCNGLLRLGSQPWKPGQTRVIGLAFAGNPPALFDDRLTENITLYQPISAAELNRILRAVGLSPMLRRVGLTLDSRVGEAGERLSLGMRQRLILARLLLHRPPVVLLDEVFSAIQPGDRIGLWRTLRETLSHSFLLLATSDPALVEEIGNVLFLQGGEMHACGRHEELLQTSEAYKRYWHARWEATDADLSHAVS